MNMILVKLYHIKLQLFGDKEFIKNGNKIIPCKECGKDFKSYLHYGEMSDVFDNLCKGCKGE